MNFNTMRLLYSPVFLVCSFLFAAHQITQRVLDIPIPLADAYLDNVLATPILLTLLVAERRLLFRRGEDYTLTLAETVLATLWIAVVGEVLFPYFSEQFTADWLDVVFYLLGSVLFYFTINRPVKRTHPGI